MYYSAYMSLKITNIVKIMHIDKVISKLIMRLYGDQLYMREVILLRMLW